MDTILHYVFVLLKRLKKQFTLKRIAGFLDMKVLQLVDPLQQDFRMTSFDSLSTSMTVAERATHVFCADGPFLFEPPPASWSSKLLPSKGPLSARMQAARGVACCSTSLGVRRLSIRTNLVWSVCMSGSFAYVIATRVNSISACHGPQPPKPPTPPPQSSTPNPPPKSPKPSTPPPQPPGFISASFQSNHQKGTLTKREGPISLFPVKCFVGLFGAAWDELGRLAGQAAPAYAEAWCQSISRYGDWPLNS